MSAEIRNDRAMDWPRADGVLESLLRRDGMRLDSAPEVETLPISSWLNKAIQLTFPSKLETGWEPLSARASTAQKLLDCQLGTIRISLRHTMTRGYPYADQT